jgi:hypothetical protein
MKRLSHRLTYANVVSTICLFLLLGGGAAFAASQLPKNSVGPKQIKRGAITPAKLATTTKQAFDSISVPGPAGPAGQRGATGPQGPAGPQGAAGATKVVVRVGKQELGSEVLCKPGEVAVSGGGITVDSQTTLYASLPIDADGETTSEGKAPQGWFAGAEDTAGTEGESIAYVVCGSP